MTYKKSDIVAIVSKIKSYYKRIYRLPPAELADFMKIRSNFLRLGAPLSDEKLEMPEEEIIKYLTNALNLTKQSDETVKPSINVQTSITEALSVDVSTINDDRTEIRKHLFNENITVVLERTGRVFNVGWNGKMNVCKVSVPSTWQINAPQSLIFDMSEKDANVFDNPNTYEIRTHPGLTKFGGYIYELLTRHSDFTIIKRIVEAEFDSANNVFIKNIDKRKMTKLKNKGFSEPVAALLIALAEQVEAKTFSEYYILNIFGYRKRLTQELTNLLK